MPRPSRSFRLQRTYWNSTDKVCELPHLLDADSKLPYVPHIPCEGSQATTADLITWNTLLGFAKPLTVAHTRSVRLFGHWVEELRNHLICLPVARCLPAWTLGARGKTFAIVLGSSALASGSRLPQTPSTQIQRDMSAQTRSPMSLG